MNALEERLARELATAARLAPAYRPGPVRRRRGSALLAAACVAALAVGGAIVADVVRDPAPPAAPPVAEVSLPTLHGPEDVAGPDPARAPCDVVAWKATDAASVQIQTADCTRTWLAAAPDTALSSVALSPDGSRVAALVAEVVSAGRATALVVLDLATREVTTALTTPGLTAAAWSADGARLAAATPGTLLLVTPGEAPERVEGLPVAVTELAWAPDGERIAFAGGELGVLDLSTGAVTAWADAPDGPLLGWLTGDSLVVSGESGSEDLTGVDVADGAAMAQPLAGTNGAGESYGPGGGNDEPDLVPAYGVNGRGESVLGYARGASLDRPQPRSPEEAQTYNDITGYVVQLYLSDGTTRVGAFAVGEPVAGPR